MADKKISELDAITGANTAATDVFVVVDTSTGQTKKITREELNNAIEQDVLDSIDIDTINGDFTVNGDINLGDNDKAIFGAGSDLQIYHDGSNSIIRDAGTGGLHIRASANLQLQDSDGYLYVNCIDGGNGGTTKLYNLNQEKLATTSTGIDVTGTVTADNLKVEGGSSGRVTVSKFINTTNAASTEVAISLQNSASTDPCNINLVAYRDGANYGSDFYIETSDNIDGTDRKRFYITEGGDISFYEDTGTTAKLFWDASEERLGLGTSSPSQKLHVSGGQILLNNGSDFYINSSSSVSYLYTVSTPLLFYTNTDERMRIDSSGNVLVGTTDTTLYNNSGSGNGGIALSMPAAGAGRIDVARAGNCYTANRLASDGNFFEFFKDGTQVGSIGVEGGDNFYITDNNNTGLNMKSGLIIPCNTDGSTRDNAIDLGASGGRFNDLYLGGGVYVGGTGSANHLDDYEEGTWTPTVQGSSTTGTYTYALRQGIYTKVGNIVSVNIAIYVTATGTVSTGNLRIAGLPFATSTAASFHSFSLGWSQYIPVTNDFLGVYNGSGLSYLQIRNVSDASGADVNASQIGSSGTGAFYIFISGTYRAA